MQIKYFWQKQKQRMEKFTIKQLARPYMLTNLAINLYEEKQGQTRLKSKPWNVIIELTANCNLACRMCRNTFEKYDPSRDMDWELFTTLANKLFPSALMVDLRSQGETTIARNWKKVLEYILPFSARFALVTNGMNFEEETIEKMAKKHIGITVSFDGATQETFEYIRKGANFEMVCRHIRQIAKAQRKYRNSIRNLSLRVTAQRDNLSELPAIIDLAYEMGVGIVQIQPVMSGDERELKYHKEWAYQQLLKAKQRGRELGLVEVEIPFQLYLMKTIPQKPEQLNPMR